MTPFPWSRDRVPVALAGIILSLAAGAWAGSGEVTQDKYIEVGSVLVPVVVLDQKGRSVAGLGREDFRLKVDGKTTEIEYFEGGDAPLAIAIVIDASASMVGARFDAARAAGRELIERMGPRDRAVIITFDHRARIITPLTAQRTELESGLQSMATGGGTALYDALDLAIHSLAPEAGRKALVLLSDGEDTLSRKSPATVERRARRSQVVLYAVAFGAEHGNHRLKELAIDLGGLALHPESPEQLLLGYQAIFEEMRTQYTLSFIPASDQDGNWHPISVTLATPDLQALKVRSRRGWLAAEGKTP